MPNKTIKLIAPIEGQGTEGNPSGQIHEIVLREPKFRDIMLLGEPAAFARSDGGMIYQAEKDDVIAAYIDRLLVEPKDPALLNQLGVTDTMQLKDAVFGFFQIAKTATTQP